MSGCRVGDDVERCRGDRPAAAPRALPGDLPRVLAGKKFVFFTGKGGQGKTSVACATALALADGGRKTLLVSTDPASNLGQALGLADGGLAGVSAAVGAPSSVCGNLWAANVDPEKAAAAYRKKALRALMARGADDDELDRAEEGLAGQCTVEIAAFDAFAGVLARPDAAYDVVVFDTAPTGHTLRLLGLAWEWTAFFGKSPTGASCLGPVEALAAQAETFAAARAALADGARTALLLVARPESSALAEAARTAGELAALDVAPAGLVLNGVLETPGDDAVAKAFAAKQRAALSPESPKIYESSRPWRSRPSTSSASARCARSSAARRRRPRRRNPSRPRRRTRSRPSSTSSRGARRRSSCSWARAASARRRSRRPSASASRRAACGRT